MAASRCRPGKSITVSIRSQTGQSTERRFTSVAPTPIGALTFGVGAATNSWSVWLALGQPNGNGSILAKSLFR